MNQAEMAAVLKADFDIGTERAEKFAQLDSYYVLWAGAHFSDTNFLINFNFERLLKIDPKFRGFLCNTGTEGSLGRLSVYRNIGPLEFLRRKRKGEKIGLVSFCSTPLELRFFESLSDDIYSYICVMQANKIWHTYTPLDGERAFIQENLPRFTDIIENFEDETSKRMLLARLRGISSLNTHYMVNNQYPISYEYFNDKSPEYSFMLNDTEVVCDVGASWGDGVIRFAQTVKDLEGSRIYAFEPNQGEYNQLRMLEHFMPLKASNALVSKESGTENFLSNTGNLLGSRIAVEGDANVSQKQVVKLDDVCDDATLIKIDAEGAEPDILVGASRLLENPNCRLSSCIYHYPADLFKTIDIMKGLGRERFFFRQHHASMWDGLVYFH